MITLATNSDDNRRYGDERDDGGSGLNQGLNNLKNNNQQASQLGADASKEVSKGVANASNQAGQQAVQVAVEGAKAAGETGASVATGVSTGTAVGGPIGAAVGAAWGLRHTIVKVIGAFAIIILAFCSFFYTLPDVVFYSVFGLDGGNNEANMTIESTYSDLAEAIQVLIDDAYEETYENAKKKIQQSGYDFDISLENMTDNAKNSAHYDVAHILAAYSVMLEDDETPSKDDLLDKLDNYKNSFFPITSEVKTEEVVVPVEYWTYKPVTINYVVSKTLTGYINGEPYYFYNLGKKTVYVQDELCSTKEPMEIDNYVRVTCEVPIMRNGMAVDTTYYTCYEFVGKKTVTPTKEEQEYLAVTINSFQNSVINQAFGVDGTAQYKNTTQTVNDVIETKTLGLKYAIYGAVNTGDSVPLTDAELLAMVDRLDCCETRKELVKTGLSLVGKVPYFWGGKSPAGWNEEWGQPKVVTASGSSSTGQIRPYGLDCSGFTDWCYKTTLGITLYEGSWKQVQNCHPIDESDLKPGDLGFLFKSDGVTTSHVLMFVDYDDEGNRVWVHCTYPEGVVVNTPYYDYKLKLYRPNNVVYGDE